jgi:hypothetical protein
MPLITRPSLLPRWADTVEADPTKVLEPPDGKKDIGWIVEKPPHQWENWLRLLTYQWIAYFERKTDIASRDIDFVVGTGVSSTHAFLQDAIDDAVPGQKILVASSAAVAATINVNQNNLEIIFKPGVTYTQQSTTTPCLYITGTNVRIKGGTFNGFSTGVSPTAIHIDAAAVRAKLFDINFTNNTVDIDDDSESASILGCTFS